MDNTRLVLDFWRRALNQDAAALRAYFAPGARVRWVSSNEDFTVEEYIRANCEYPGEWRGEVERLEVAGPLVISAARVWNAENGVFFHAVSFFEWHEGKITALDEYWSDDGPPPKWRRDKNIGKPIYPA